MKDPGKISIKAMATAEGKPFCLITTDGREGELTPGEVRTMALGWLATAEAAEQDAMVISALTDPTGIAMPLELAIAVVIDIRKRRAEVQGIGEIDANPENTIDQRDEA